MKIKIESPAEGIVRSKKEEVNRSSALFYVQTDRECDTIICFLNHFLVKRGIKSVAGYFMIRDTTGALVRSESFLVDEPRVYELSVRKITGAPFIGSIEIIFTSDENLAVPFCAVSAVYRTRNGICQVHSYSRRYNPEEIGTAPAVVTGVETGWSLRDDSTVESFFVLHGGPSSTADRIELSVWNAQGERRDLSRVIARSANDTCVMTLATTFGFDAAAFLAGREGFATISFCTDRVFPRLLCGNRRMDANGRIVDLQATHSNFDFSVFAQPQLPPDATAWVNIPGHVAGCRSTLILYPGVTPQQGLKAVHDGRRRDVFPGLTIDFEGERPVIVDFEPAKNGFLPSRIVSGLKVVPPGSALPCECSYGALTSELGVVPKRFYWGLAMSDGGLSWMSGFHRALVGQENQTLPAVLLTLFDTEGRCGGGSIDWEVFDKGPVDLSPYFERVANGTVFYTCFAEGVIAWFFSFIFDPRRGSGSLEHSF